MNQYLLRAARISLTLWLGCLSLTAWADGKITHLSGPVSVQKLDGKTVIGMVGVKIVSGETVTTGQGAFVRVEMTDSSEVVLRPDSVLKLEGYQFNPAKPADDKMVMNAVKGGLRTVTGLIGKRGNQNAYELKTPTATIGIRGTQFDARICPPGACGALPPGTYVAVKFGAVVASNPQGEIPIPAGKVGHIPVDKPPVMLPRDPGIGFSPPPSIPKLDEKKKVQEAAKANESAGGGSGGNTGAGNAGGGAGSGGENKPAENKPADNNKGSSSNNKPATASTSSSSTSGSASNNSAADGGSDSPPANDANRSTGSTGGSTSNSTTSNATSSGPSTKAPSSSTLNNSATPGGTSGASQPAAPAVSGGTCSIQ